MHVALAVGVALIVGGILAYAFRGKESAALRDAGAEAKKVAGEVKSKL